MPEPTYRPYLTASELSRILTCLKTHPEYLQNLGIVRKLELFSAKINLGHTSPAYAPVPTMAEKLEISDAPAPKTISQIREECYRKFTTSRSDCSAREIEHAQAYRYEHDLMNANEELEYEQMRLT